MNIKYVHIISVILIFVCCQACNSQSQPAQKEADVFTESNVQTPEGPQNIVRMIKEDKHDDMWIAAFDGVFRYDGSCFTNMTRDVSSARFFSVLDDSKGNYWFGSIGSGLYHYDGDSFQNYTTDDGLVSNEVVCIYEDKSGHIWLGANGGMSRYDGQSFQNFMIKGDTIIEEKTGKFTPHMQRPPSEVNSIIEDKTGQFWFATRGNTYTFDGQSFKIVSYNDRAFSNVRWMIEDKKGFIWLGGNDGLWRYDGNSFSNFSENFTGYIYEDSKGNIWTSSQSVTNRKWILSRYDELLLPIEQTTVTEIMSEFEDNQGMLFGILEANDGRMWVGTLNGVYLYDGISMTKFKTKSIQD